ncbi:MAG: FAD binding domain-containing protein, partial [Planctomycetota bacterium JB042]
MNRFEYAHPSTVDEAVRLLGKSFDEAAVLAGGTDLLSLMKDFVVEPRRLVSIAGVTGLGGIRADDAGLRIGAATTLDELVASKEVRVRAPGVHQAAAGIRSRQMRAMGTVGGELLQRPRCWYFRRGLGLLAQDAGGSLVERGDHRDHAVFGNAGAAKFVHASSLAPILIALGARATLRGPSGERSIPVAEMFRTPGREGERESTLAPNELLIHVDVPAGSSHDATVEIRHRRGLDWPQAAAACALTLDGDRVAEASLVLGHVAPTPWIE